MATSLFERERIMTTMPKAKQLRPFAEKLISWARKGDLHSRRLAAQYIHDKNIVKKLFDDIAKRFTDGDKGGYTRIVGYSARWGYGAERAFIELKHLTISSKEEEKGGKKAKESKAKEVKPKDGKEAKASKETKLLSLRKHERSLPQTEDGRAESGSNDQQRRSCGNGAARYRDFKAMKCPYCGSKQNVSSIPVNQRRRVNSAPSRM
jgi:large subunit ribosomal protein L17